jgi:hypothetical protein
MLSVEDIIETIKCRMREADRDFDVATEPTVAHGYAAQVDVLRDILIEIEENQKSPNKLVLTLSNFTNELIQDRMVLDGSVLNAKEIRFTVNMDEKRMYFEERVSKC